MRLMKRNKQYIIPLSLAAMLGLFSGCASLRHSSKVITTTPAPYVLTPDSANQVSVNMVFHLPEEYFSRRSRLFISPQLIVADSVREEFCPLVIDAPIYGKKLNRRKVLDNYVDPYANQAIKVDKASSSMKLPYNRTLQLPQGVDAGRIVAVISTDGCGDCTGIDTIDVAAISNPVTLIDNQLKESLQLSWIEPEFVIRPKIMKGRGVANLQFGINKFDINLAEGNNRQELEEMLNKLSPILGDSLATLNFITIDGMASADGSLAFNTTLSHNRANSAKGWLISRLNIRPEVQRKISVGSRPEGWEPVLAAMVADGNSDSVVVRAILTKYQSESDDVQERYIRRLPSWNIIKEKYLQKDRKVEYVYAYTLKSFTSDKELLDMYRKRPDAFNEDELLRVAALASTDSQKMEVYKTIIRYFPQSKVASNNLAVLYLNIGQEEQARNILEQVAEYSPEMLNTLAASYIYTNDYEKAIELLQTVNLPEARYNLGLLKAKQRKMNEAYELLRPFADVNSAVMALSLNKNLESENILSTCLDKTPIAEYVRSLTAARLKKHDIFYQHIDNACRESALRRRAASEADFYRYQAEEAFQTLIDQ